MIEHPLQLKKQTRIFYYIILKGLTDGVALKGNVVTPLLQAVNEDSQIFNSNIIATHTKIVYTWNEIKEGLLEGQCVLFMEGEKRSLLINRQKVGQRERFKNPFQKLLLKAHMMGLLRMPQKT